MEEEEEEEEEGKCMNNRMSGSLQISLPLSMEVPVSLISWKLRDLTSPLTDCLTFG